MGWIIRTRAAQVRGQAIDLVDVPIECLHVYPAQTFAVVEHVAGEYSPSPFEFPLGFHNVTNPQTQNLPPLHMRRRLRWFHNLERPSARQSCAGVACELCVGPSNPLLKDLQAQHITHECKGGFKVGCAAEHPIKTSNQRCVGVLAQFSHSSTVPPGSARLRPIERRTARRVTASRPPRGFSCLASCGLT